MNTQELLKLGTNVSITLNVKDLQEVINYTVQATRRELEQTIIEDKQEVYLTRNQVCEILNIDQSTLWRWEKRNYLDSINIGGKKRYPRSTIKQRFTNGKNINIK